MNQKFSIHTDIYFGKNSLKKLYDIPMKRVCLITETSMIDLGLTKSVEDILKQNNIEYKIFDKVKPDPTVEIVSVGVSHLVDFKPDTVLALGGGSVIDTAKAIIYLDLRLQEKILRSEDFRKIKLIAIPTTSGTGSEVTSYAVITDTQNNRKIPLLDKNMIPDVAILDSNFTKTLPKKIIAESGMDVLTHAIESYVSPQGTPFSRACATESLQLVRDNLIAMYDKVAVDEYRDNMHIASCLAGLAFEASSLGLNHGIAHSIGAAFHLAHGLCNAVLLPHIINTNASLARLKGHTQLIEKYEDIATIFCKDLASETDKIDALIRFIINISSYLNIPEHFSDLGLDREKYIKNIPTMAKDTMADRCTAGNPVKVTLEDVVRTYIVTLG